MAKLTRRDELIAMNSIELEIKGDDIFAGDDQLVDVTHEIYDCLSELKGCQMFCKDDFDLNDSMSAFEVMCPKMDVRHGRDQVLTPKKAIASGVLVPVSDMSVAQKIGMMQQFFVQFATWQQQGAMTQQTVYSCLYLAENKFYQDDEFMGPFFRSVVYAVEIFYRASSSTWTLRDEDITLPPGFSV